MNNPQDPNTIVLCDPCCNKCPKLVRQEDGTILVRDDFSGQIKLTADDLNLFVQWAKEGRFNHWLPEPAVVN